MPQWPSSWRESTLREADIPVTTVRAHRVERVAQVDTHRTVDKQPARMPARGYSAPRALNSPYAAFPPASLRAAFTKAAHSVAVNHCTPCWALPTVTRKHGASSTPQMACHGHRNRLPVSLLDLLESTNREKLQTPNRSSAEPLAHRPRLTQRTKT